MNMKSPLAKATVAFAVTLFLFQVVIPSLFQMFLPVSSSLCIEPAPPNQIKSIQLEAESAAAFFPPALARSLQAQIIRVEINPYRCGDSQPILYIDCKNGMMEVNHNWVRKRRGVFDTPFSEDSLQAVFDEFKAPHSPQQGPINVSEVYSTIKAVCTADIKDKNIPGLNNLSHYKLSYVFPYKASSASTTWMTALIVGLSFYRTSKKKPEDGYSSGVVPAMGLSEGNASTTNKASGKTSEKVRNRRVFIFSTTIVAVALLGGDIYFFVQFPDIFQWWIPVSSVVVFGFITYRFYGRLIKGQ